MSKCHNILPTKLNFLTGCFIKDGRDVKIVWLQCSGFQ